jgi:outer membrane biosynthesis protein TonB
MTRPKRVFAEMLAKAQGGEDVDVDDICDNLTLADIMYELKKLEKEAEAEAAPEPEPEPEEKPKPEPEPEPPRPIPDFWSRLSGE